jgi:hypothetical protein
MLAIARHCPLGDLSVDSAWRRVGQAWAGNTFESAPSPPGRRSGGDLAGPLEASARTTIALERIPGGGRTGPSRSPCVKRPRRRMRQSSSTVARGLHLPAVAGGVVCSVDVLGLLIRRPRKRAGISGHWEHSSLHVRVFSDVAPAISPIASTKIRLAALRS